MTGLEGLYNNFLRLRDTPSVYTSQAGKFIKVNADGDALEFQGLFDWQTSVKDKDLTAPPGSPSTGDRYIIATPATGAWAGEEDNIAEYNGSSWDFTDANEGMITWVEDEDLYYVYDGSSWNVFGASVSHASLTNLSYANAGHTGFEPTVTKGNLTETTSTILTITGGTGAVIGSGLTIQVALANTSTNGYLSSTDWNTFNGKAAADQTMYIGTTAVAINRTSAALTLADITLTTPDIGTPASGILTNCTFPTLNQNTSGTAAIATTVTAADESADTGCYVAFVTDVSGNLGIKTGTNLIFNSNTGQLEATIITNGTISLSGADITGVANMEVTETITFDTEYDNGDSSTADTIDWGNGNKQKTNMTGDCTYTFTAPDGPCNLILRMIHDTSARNPSWPGTVLWSGGAEPTWSTSGADVDIASFYYNGTNYYGQAGVGFA